MGTARSDELVGSVISGLDSEVADEEGRVGLWVLLRVLRIGTIQLQEALGLVALHGLATSLSVLEDAHVYALAHFRAVSTP